MLRDRRRRGARGSQRDVVAADTPGKDHPHDDEGPVHQGEALQHSTGSGKSKAKRRTHQKGLFKSPSNG
jgi:hypothetical protein